MPKSNDKNQWSSDIAKQINDKVQKTRIPKKSHDSQKYKAKTSIIQPKKSKK